MDWRVTDYIESIEQWKPELIKAREICLDCELEETFKWRQPCYAFDGGNVVILSGFKNYFAFSFFKGALIADPDGILIQPTETMQAGRHLRYTEVSKMVEAEEVIKKYITAAIEIERAGLKVEFKDTSEFEVPVELSEVFKSDPDYKAAFDALTPGRQRGYLLHFGSAKQSKTRISRIEKNRARIFTGKGFNER